ncbi:MAG: hypothetical protein ACI9HY_003194, partial [Planctomycetaceae bacterium]
MSPLILEGSPALSAFRVEKVLKDIGLPQLKGLLTRYLHFVDVEVELSDEDTEKLKVILSYGP